jgi:orotate phosphoribosyltransferase
MGYDADLADVALDISAIKLWPKEGPFLWASGFYMPIYNDNRMLLGNFQHRMLVAEGMKSIIDKKGLKPDFISGTSTSGIAPAATLADMLDIPLVVQKDGQQYSFEKSYANIWRGGLPDVDVVVSSCPFGIPLAVRCANEQRLPFAYVRAEKKEHGLKKQVEGILNPGSQALILEAYLLVGDAYTDVVKDILTDRGVGIVANCAVYGFANLFDVKGKKGLQIEDLVSTGGSCVDEILLLRDKGAHVDNCISIFSYGLEKAVSIFGRAGVELSAVLEYPTLLAEALNRGYIPKESLGALEEWRLDPFNWGEKHNYLPVKK